MNADVIDKATLDLLEELNAVLLFGRNVVPNIATGDEIGRIRLDVTLPSLRTPLCQSICPVFGDTIQEVVDKAKALRSSREQQARRKA